MKFMNWAVAFCAAFLAIAPFATGPARAGQNAIMIEHPWVRESPLGGTSGGGYLTIVNTGDKPDRLIGAETPDAKQTLLKETTYVGDAMQTRTLTSGIEIPPGESVQLRWEAQYLLFVDLKEPFRARKIFKATLKFEHAGQVPVQFWVRPRVDW